MTIPFPGSGLVDSAGRLDPQKAYLIRDAIGSLEKQLDPRKFRRIHRSAIVNIDCIRELHPMFRGEYRVVMRDGTDLKLSHNYRENLEQQLGRSL